MRTSMHLKPGRKGTKQLLAQYGDRLVCVRYRHDTQQKKRFKTVELIVAEWAWEPPVRQIPADQRVALRIGPRSMRSFDMDIFRLHTGAPWPFYVLWMAISWLSWGEQVHSILS